MTVTFIDPRLDRLSDEQLTQLEKIVAVMEGEAAAANEPAPTPEQIALRQLQEENEQLRRRSEHFEKLHSEAVHELDRERCERANSEIARPEPSVRQLAPLCEPSNVVRLPPRDEARGRP